ncbi:MAG: PIN domain-containing protein [Planctomycetaceae bacterium]|nr:PIN domain-containing protein [Planctomycetaceae bacterium]
MTPVLVDAGPLVAVLAKRDQHHALCVDILKTLPPPLVTCWPVITETTYLLQQYPEAIQSLFRMLEHGLLTLLPLDATAAPWLAQFFEQYHDQEPQLADAALVYLAEREKLDRVFTLDHRHFRVFRIAGTGAFQLLPDQL